jgi:cell division protein FtsQ
VDKKEQEVMCHALRITICDSAVNRFVSAPDIRSLLDREGKQLINMPLYQINTYELEQLLNARSVIRNAEVFPSIDGTLHIKVYQRRPIIRLQTSAGNFYIDESGYIFPLSVVYTSYVPIATGNIPMSARSNHRGEIPPSDKFLQQLYEFAVFLQNHDFWQAQILQIHVVNAREVELVPRVGNQIIKLGGLDKVEYKLEKLDAFYKKAMPVEGWNKYRTIDLRFSNQVVCTLK